MNIRALAKLAGVSKTTAAYAVQNNPRVSEEIRERVQTLAKQHGYKPNLLVKAYMNEMRRGEVFRKRLYSLCYLSSMNTDGRYPRHSSYEFERQILQGAMHEAKELGYHLEVVTWDPAAMSLDRLNQIIQARGIRGVFVGPATVPFSELALDFEQLAAIIYGYTVISPDLDRIAPDLMASVSNFAEQAFSRNYKTLIFAIDQLTDDRVGNRWTSGASALREFHGERKIRIIRDMSQDLPERVAPLIKQCKSPVVFGHSSLVDELKMRGIRIPQDCGFVACNDDSSECHTSIVQPSYAIGKLGVERLSTKVERAQWGVSDTQTRIILKCSWREGETLPRL